jgi:hypothetical protein
MRPNEGTIMNQKRKEALQRISEELISIGQRIGREDVTSAELAGYSVQLESYSRLVMHNRYQMVLEQED